MANRPSVYGRKKSDARKKGKKNSSAGRKNASREAR